MKSGIVTAVLHADLTRDQFVDMPLASSGNWTEPVGGVFARYQVSEAILLLSIAFYSPTPVLAFRQLFSTPLILTLLLVGGLLIPIVYFAVSQLAQIQTPDQMGVRKDPISGDKKTQ